MTQPALFEYGLLEERSDLRVHVSPKTRRLYVFPTPEAQKLITDFPDRYPLKPAWQDGVDYATGLGWVVPCRDLPLLRIVEITDEAQWVGFNPKHAPRTKGRRAAALVKWAIENGLVPLRVRTDETQDVARQIKGADLLVVAHLRIQVKCDWYAGPKKFGGTGNLFLQKAEANPLKSY